MRSRLELDTFLFKRAIVLLASVNCNILEFDLNHNSPLTVLSAGFFSRYTAMPCPYLRKAYVSCLVKRSIKRDASPKCLSPIFHNELEDARARYPGR
ncbi:hypothetical protein QUB05_25375 [Microcoleus sp. F10-C6]|uniref:hypothetical protein n=1 Tax=unclassified Microcoleus TaxID=2642155 RepID=UPI002FD0F054